MEHIFTNIEQHFDKIKDYPELCKDNLIADIRCYKKRYNNINLHNIITNFKTKSNEVILFFRKFKPN